jgi:hypothetical protein
MLEYRFYAIQKDGHIVGPPSDLNLPDDLAAVTEGKKLLSRNDIEIWERTRVVAYLTLDKK